MQTPLSSPDYTTTSLLADAGFIYKMEWVSPTDEDGVFAHRYESNGVTAESFLLADGYTKGTETVPNLSLGYDEAGIRMLGEGHYTTFTKGAELVKWRDITEVPFLGFIFLSPK